MRGTACLKPARSVRPGLPEIGDTPLDQTKALAIALLRGTARLVNLTRSFRRRIWRRSDASLALRPPPSLNLS